jgi:Activator of Hsp90 ATPase homolog 1-like protein
MIEAKIQPAPVRRSVEVAAAQARAFAVFTARMGDWWPKSHTIEGQSPQVAVVVEPRPGGRWYERLENGQTCDWGHVLAWEPPGRVLLAWQLDAEFNYDPKLVTEVEVTFEAIGETRTRVVLEHRLLERMGARAEEVRTMIDAPDGWPGILQRYAELAAAA